MKASLPCSSGYCNHPPLLLNVLHVSARPGASVLVLQLQETWAVAAVKEEAKV